MNMDDIKYCAPLELAQWIEVEYCQPIETTIESIEGLKDLCNQMNILANQYSFLVAASAMLKVYTRLSKQQGEKILADEMIDKKEIVQKAIDAVKLKHTTLSRMITIKQEINRELFMDHTA